MSHVLEENQYHTTEVETCPYQFTVPGFAYISFFRYGDYPVIHIKVENSGILVGRFDILHRDNV